MYYLFASKGRIAGWLVRERCFVMASVMGKRYESMLKQENQSEYGYGPSVIVAGVNFKSKIMGSPAIVINAIATRGERDCVDKIKIHFNRGRTGYFGLKKLKIHLKHSI